MDIQEYKWSRNKETLPEVIILMLFENSKSQIFNKNIKNPKHLNFNNVVTKLIEMCVYLKYL